MYPQTVVPLTSDIHNHLRDNHVNQTEGVKLIDGVYYTANRDNQKTWNPTNENTWEKNPVYQYGSDRYVRVTPYSFFMETHSVFSYNNGEKIERVPVAYGNASNYRWFKVEPIKWIILNSEGKISFTDGSVNATIGAPTEQSGIPIVPQGATLELYAADVLMSGIPFNLNDGLWQDPNNTMYNYLNSEFYSQAFSGTDQSLIQDSTIYNNKGNNGDEFDPSYNLNSNHLTTGGMNPTSQKIYMLSYYEMFNANSPYVVEGNKIFAANGSMTADQSRQVGGTDYARAHSLFLLEIDEKRYAPYFTRTSFELFDTYLVYCVHYTGGAADADYDYAIYGQRPALQLKLNRLV